MKTLISIIFRIALIGCISMALWGCLSPVKSSSNDTFLIENPPRYIATQHKRNLTMLVLTPETAPAYAGTDIAYSCKPYQIAYYAKTQWGETPSQMLYPLIIETLQKTKHFRAVVTSPYTGTSNYFLRTEILKLEQDFGIRPPILRLHVRTQLGSSRSGNILKTENTKITMPLLQAPPYGGIIAANNAVAAYLQRLAVFAIKNTP